MKLEPSKVVESLVVLLVVEIAPADHSGEEGILRPHASLTKHDVFLVVWVLGRNFASLSFKDPNTRKCNPLP